MRNENYKAGNSSPSIPLEHGQIKQNTHRKTTRRTGHWPQPSGRANSYEKRHSEHFAPNVAEAHWTFDDRARSIALTEHSSLQLLHWLGSRSAKAPAIYSLTIPEHQITTPHDMSTIRTKDGRQIYYKDWGNGPTVTFSHGWPLNADAWDGQMLFLAQHGFRAIAHDRRGHGRSTQTSVGNDMNGYADDLAAVIESLDLKDVTLVGHSTGGGEVARYIGRYGTKRVVKAVLISAVPPLLVKTATNPDGIPIQVFDKLRADLLRDPSQFWKNFAVPFTVRIGPVQKSRKECSMSSGSGACRPDY
jgi:hypothetical protein